MPGDPTRLVFGGLTGGRNQDLRIMAERLHLRLTRIFPELAGFTLRPCVDRQMQRHLRHLSRTSAAMTASIIGAGYCFAGRADGHTLRPQAGAAHPGRQGGDSAFDRPVPSHPLYWGNPWFDITDAKAPKAGGIVKIDGEPTSVVTIAGKVLAGVNTSESKAKPSGNLTVIDLATRTIDAPAISAASPIRWRSARTASSSPSPSRTSATRRSTTATSRSCRPAT